MALTHTKGEKGTDVPIHAMKAYRACGGITLLILNFGTGWWLVVNFKSRPLDPGDKYRYPWNSGMNGSQSRIRRYGQTRTAQPVA